MTDAAAVQTPAQLEPTPAQISERLSAIDHRLDRGAEKMEQHADALTKMAAELKANSETTNEVRELLALGRNGLKVLGWLGSAAKWLSTIATAALAVYGAFYAITHGGQMPPKP
jgi:hypothetical protein